MAESISSASEIQMDYMQLLIEQLKNQNPLEPMDSTEMASQLTQFSQLQQTEEINTNLGTLSASFDEVLTATNRSYANSLIGKKVTFFSESENEATGEITKLEGTVDSVFNDPDTSESLLGVKVGEGDGAVDYTLDLGAVVLIQN